MSDVSRTDNTTPYKFRTTDAERRKLECWKTCGGLCRLHRKVRAYWRATRAAERAALRAGVEPPPARHRHSELGRG